MIKYITLTLTAVFLFTACQQSSELDAKKAELKALKAEAKSINANIAELKAEIEKLEPKKTKDSVLVSTQKLQLVNFDRFVDLQGAVMPDETVYASSETGGRIKSVLVKEGQPVKRGQLIASIDLETLSKQMDEIQISLDLANTVYERQKRLWDQKIGSEIQYLEAKNTKERLEKSMATLSSQIAKQNVYAPISGVVDMEFLKAGEMAGPGAPIIQILNTRKVKVVADVPEKYLGKVKRGDLVSVEFPSLGTDAMKKITMIGRSIDPANRTFKMEIASTNTSGLLKPNLLASVKINDYSAKDVITIPLEIILEEVSGRKYVYTAINEGNKKVAKRTFIKTGESYLGDIIITEGLKAGDEVITLGSRNVSDNDPLEIISNKSI